MGVKCVVTYDSNVQWYNEESNQLRNKLLPYEWTRDGKTEETGSLHVYIKQLLLVFLAFGSLAHSWELWMTASDKDGEVSQ